MYKKVVREIDGYTVMRPSARHPNESHWQMLQVERRKIQVDAKGKVHCGSCWVIEGNQYGFDLHHRHYNRFGAEELEDVVLLCRPCHEAITSRIRDARRAAGDRTDEVMKGRSVEHIHRAVASLVHRTASNVMAPIEASAESKEDGTRFRPLPRHV